MTPLTDYDLALVREDIKRYGVIPYATAGRLVDEIDRLREELRNANDQAAFATANFNTKSSECTRLAADNERMQVIITESPVIAEALKIVEVEARYDDLVNRCKEMMKSLESGFTCKVGRCPWCGDMWPNPSDDGAIEAIQQIARDHDTACPKNPIRIERDLALRNLNRMRTRLVELADE